MQQMEAARVAAEDAHRQHMEALRQLEENRVVAPAFGLEPRPTAREWSLEDFLKHRPVKIGGKTSLDGANQWLKDLERIFDAKLCPEESRLAFAVYMLMGEAEHWLISTKSIFRRKFLSEYFPTTSNMLKRWSFCS